MAEAARHGAAEAGAALVALGSNLDEPAVQLRRAAAALSRLATGVRWSSIYRTEPVGGPPGQPAFLNAVVRLQAVPALAEPRALLRALQAIEHAQGRRRDVHWGPRTLDLDLLDVAGLVVDEPGLTLPHPRMMTRAFVLAPLCELAPEWRHPVSGEDACSALARVGSVGVQRTRLRWRPR